MKLKVLLLLILIGLTGSQKTFSEIKDGDLWVYEDGYWILIYKDGDQVGPTSIELPGGIQFMDNVMEFGKGTIWSRESAKKMELEFYYDYKDIILTLELNNNVLYKSEKLNVNAGECITIDISDLPSGEYTLRGQTTKQTTLKGEFTL